VVAETKRNEEAGVGIVVNQMEKIIAASSACEAPVYHKHIKRQQIRRPR
jgi:hypothetical protein